MTMHVLYRFYDEDHAPLYIGITNNPPTRFRDHRAKKEWWALVASIELSHYETRAELIAAERAAIEAEAPEYNYVHNCAERIEDYGPECDCEACNPDPANYIPEESAAISAMMAGWLGDGPVFTWEEALAAERSKRMDQMRDALRKVEALLLPNGISGMRPS